VGGDGWGDGHVPGVNGEDALSRGRVRQRHIQHPVKPTWTHQRLQ